MTLQYLKTTRGVETNVYNGMYFSGKLGDPNLGEMSYTKFLQQLGKIDADLLNHYAVADQTQPEIVPLAWEDWGLMCSDTTYSGNNNTGSMGWLLDDDSKKCFSPGKRFEIKTYELTFDMKTPQMVHGFKFVQAAPMLLRKITKKYWVTCFQPLRSRCRMMPFRGRMRRMWMAISPWAIMLVRQLISRSRRN